MKVTLFAIPASHPAMAVRAMLEHKRISYKRVDLMPVVSRAVLKAMRFPEITIPALKLDGERISGSSEIARALERLAPEPPLIPAEPTLRAEVEAVEAWGESELQDMVRRILWAAISLDRAPLASYAEGARLGVPISLAVKTAAPIVWAERRINSVSEEAVRADLAAFPAALDRIDGWIADGTLGTDEPNVADFQIAASIRLAMTLEDLRGAIEERPAGRHAMRFVPEYPGNAPAVFPPEWLAPRAAA